MSVTTVAVTGGNGSVGRAVLSAFDEAGYETVNLNRGTRREAVADAYHRTDLLDAGEVYGSLAKCDPDAVVHLGMVPNPETTPDHVTFESNAMSTYHVLDAASALDVESVVLASSLSALGAGFEPDPPTVRYLPLDEEHPLSPSTPYGLGKQVLEVTADGVARRADAPPSIVSMRFPWVASDENLRETFVEADRSLAGVRAAGDFHVARNTLASYVHREDAARAVRLAVETAPPGHERLVLSAPDTTLEEPSAEMASDLYPDARVLGSLSGHESLLDTTKAETLLGWSAERSWREL